MTTATLSYRLPFSKWLPALAWVAIGALAAIRFLNLDADFPLGITWSSELYTDEGWYANAAVRRVLFGAWYMAGDFNPIVNMPIGQLLHGLFFAVFGVSIFTARLPETLAFLCAIYFSALTVKAYSGKWASLLATLIIAANYVGFAYSRLAIMEPIGMAFVAAALYAATKAKDGRALPLVIGAAVLSGLACLTKGSMVFSIPLVAYLAFLSGKTKREGILLVCTTLVVALAITGGYQLAMMHSYHLDYVYFNDINAKERFVTGGRDWLRNTIHQAHGVFSLGKSYIAISALLIVWAAASSSAFRKNPLVHVFFGYGAIYFAFISVLHYGPPRYFVPLLIPISCLCAIACIDLKNVLDASAARQKLALLPTLLALGFVLVNCMQISTYLANPRYTFVDMMREAGDIIRKKEGSVSDTMIVGDMANSVTLETGIQSINQAIAPMPMADRLGKFRPKYAFLLEYDNDFLGAFPGVNADITKISSWNVYGNYYKNGKKVMLLSLAWRDEIKR